MTHTVSRRVYVYKENNRHPIDALTHCVDQIGLKVAWDHYPAVLFYYLNHIWNWPALEHPRLSYGARHILDIRAPSGSPLIFVHVDFWNKTIGFEIEGSGKLGNMHPADVHFRNDPAKRLCG